MLCLTPSALWVPTSHTGAYPYNSLVTCYQLFQQDKEPRAQTVEVIKNDNIGGSFKTAVRKGDWSMSGTKVTETSARLEYGGALENTNKVENEFECTFLGDRVRIMRGKENSLFVYSRMDAAAVGNEIKSWLDSDVNDIKSRWEIGWGGSSPSTMSAVP